MPGPRSTLQVEGTFKELAEEFAHFLDQLPKESEESLASEVAPLLEKYTTIETQETENEDQEDDLDDARDEVLRVLVKASPALNSAPDNRKTTSSTNSLRI